jgi:hypothetical protein
MTAAACSFQRHPPPSRQPRTHASPPPPKRTFPLRASLENAQSPESAAARTSEHACHWVAERPPALRGGGSGGSGFWEGGSGRSGFGGVAVAGVGWGGQRGQNGTRHDVCVVAMEMELEMGMEMEMEMEMEIYKYEIFPNSALSCACTNLNPITST